MDKPAWLTLSPTPIWTVICQAGTIAALEADGAADIAADTAVCRVTVDGGGRRPAPAAGRLSALLCNEAESLSDR
jgi:hypothetical protein